MPLFRPFITALRRRRIYRHVLGGPVRAVILRYHSVGEPAAVAEYLDPGLSLPPDDFRRQLKLLASKYDVLPLDQLLARVKDPRPGRFAVSLTFDDGYRDNHDVVVPLLRDFGMSGTFYVATTALTSGRGLWISELWRLVPRLPDGRLDWPDPAPQHVPSHRDHAARVTFRRQATSWLASLTATDREHAFDLLAARAGVPRGDGLAHSFLTPDLVLAMRRAGMTIGAHTQSHPHLDLLAPAGHDAEVAGSQRDLEAILGESVTHFAYPNPGGSGLAGDTARASVARAGFLTAVTSQSDPLSPTPDLLRLPRLGVYAGAQQRTLFSALR